ncbi:DEAD/DEAH box helicase [Enterovibrio norvegicus]|nr:DEAD/DEAH box helicase [Enterovibrio norvegicus]
MVFERLTLNKDLEDCDIEFILLCAILFVREYEKDKRKTQFFEIAYYISLKIGISYNHYDALLDLSTNFGLYPITKFIVDNINKEKHSLNNFSIDYKLDKFKHNDIYETLDQKNSRISIIESKERENCFIAPTSFGKSSLIKEIIENDNSKRIAIIVPTKSLLVQTYRFINGNFPNRKTIFHDEMHNGSDDFIGIFTQERALRLLKNKEISFDLLVIDEAHNIFDLSSRSLLLTRLIRRNKNRNNNSKIYYLSPLIADTNNLKTDESQYIHERKIAKNIKEPNIFEMTEDGISYNYNRFLDKYYPCGKYLGYLDYIEKNKKKKNFIYLRNPKKIETLAAEINENLPFIYHDNLDSLSDVISKNVHNDFYCVEYVRKGFLYIHGKLPDLLKEFLEFKFKDLKEINTLIANSVILEGVNLPIDNLFILNTYKLGAKELTNLIGRVNRLNDVFSPDSGDLSKLMPSVNFVNNKPYNSKNGNMRNKISKLKNNTFNDEIKNPILVNFDIESLEDKYLHSDNATTSNEAFKKLSIAEKIKEKEDFLVYGENEEDNKTKLVFIEAGVDHIYKDFDSTFLTLDNRIYSLYHDSNWKNLDTIEKVHHFFILGLEDKLTNSEFSRLKHEKARSFYRMFNDNTHKYSLKEHISEMVRYFHSIKNTEKGKYFYIGESYGEIQKYNPEIDTWSKKSYVNLYSKEPKDLVNIALVKIKIESDFMSYTLHDYVNILSDLNLVAEDEYNTFIYGTAKKSNSEYIKLGLSGSVVTKLEKEGQLSNLKINQFGTIIPNSDFIDYSKKQDEMVLFELGKYIEL